MQIYLVTSNPKKINEFKQIMPKNIKISTASIDLNEIQSLDTKKVIKHKLKKAYSQIHKPVIVEDVSVELKDLNGLPGPFVKYFMQQLGRDALYKIAPNSKVKVISTMGFYDGKNTIIVNGVVNGKIAPPSKVTLFGFDCTVIPNGQTKTFAELGNEYKNLHSHRALASKKLVSKLENYLNK